VQCCITPISLKLRQTPTCMMAYAHKCFYLFWFFFSAGVIIGFQQSDITVNEDDGLAHICAVIKCSPPRNKSDISYLKTSRPFDILIHSRALLAAILCWLATLYAPQVAARFWRSTLSQPHVIVCIHFLCFLVSISNSKLYS